MLMSRLVFLLVYRRKINLFCLLVKRTLKPRPTGEVAAIADGEGFVGTGVPDCPIMVLVKSKQ